MAAFKDLKTPEEIKEYLLNVLSRTGGKSKSEVCLYHYSKLSSLFTILSSGYIWLGSSEYMNDYMEGEFINSVEGRSKLFFSCFSRVEENLAMYKMYAPSPDGAMMAISFKTAQDIIANLPMAAENHKYVRIVRDNKLTDETVEANIYWAAIAYKDLHTDLLKAETVVNTQIQNPLNNNELAGYVKLYGWEYEKEVRLCASLPRPLGINERIAIPLPKDILKSVSIITGPAFDKQVSRDNLAKMKRMGVSVHDSEYDALVDLGYNTSSVSEKRINELEKENERLKAYILELENSNSIYKNSGSFDNLSFEASLMLLYASTDPHGKIVYSIDFTGSDISTAGFSFCNYGSAEEKARWVGALEELEEFGYVSKKGKGLQIFELKKRGFDAAREIKKHYPNINTKVDPHIYMKEVVETNSTNIMLLSEVVLLFAAELDGTIDVCKDKFGTTFVVGNKYNMNSSQDAEEIAKWDAVIEYLVDEKLIAQDKQKGLHTIYLVKHAGYERAKNFKFIRHIDTDNNTPADIIKEFEE